MSQKDFKIGLTTPLLKCLNSQQKDYVMRELHEGIYDLHTEGHSLATKAVRASYYWPTLKADASTLPGGADDAKSLQTCHAPFLTAFTV